MKWGGPTQCGIPGGLFSKKAGLDQGCISFPGSIQLVIRLIGVLKQRRNCSRPGATVCRWITGEECQLAWEGG